VLAKRYLQEGRDGPAGGGAGGDVLAGGAVIAREDAKYGATEEEVEALAREFYALMTRGSSSRTRRR
jgi:hypothetical protein